MRIALHPAEQSNIRVELWLPDEWNGRYAATGNGGIGGSLVYDLIAKMMRDGCACANPDIGTSAGLTSGFENDEVKADFGYRATHLMAVRLGYGLIMNPPFIDGNKRIGTHAMLLTLKRNGIQLSDTQEELAEIILNIASSQKEYGSLLAWVIHPQKN